MFPHERPRDLYVEPDHAPVNEQEIADTDALAAADIAELVRKLRSYGRTLPMQVSYATGIAGKPYHRYVDLIAGIVMEAENFGLEMPEVGS